MITKSNPRLYRAYLVKEKLRLVLKHPNENIETAIKKERAFIELKNIRIRKTQAKGNTPHISNYLNS